MHIEFSMDSKASNEMYVVRLDANNKFYIIKF
jgi:hypothetical protein